MNNKHTELVPALIALDWGTSSLRAYLLGQAGQILHTRSTAQGLQALPLPGVAGFEKAFADIAGDWLASWPQLPVVAGGMVGSAQGWKEAPYVRCPVDVGALAQHSVSVPSGLGVEVVIAPGLLLDEADNPPDVIRGEEIQIAGALATNPALAEAATLVMPGTHSKWVQIKAGQINHFSSYMTGEIFSVLVKHSILGRLMTETVGEDPSTQATFAQGVEAAHQSQPGDFTHQIFAARTLGLTQRLPQHLLKSYLSGLVIGHELVSGLAKSSATRQTQGPLLLIGEPSLCQRYAQAFAILGVPVTGLLDNPAPRGLWEFAKALGLIHQPQEALH